MQNANRFACGGRQPFDKKNMKESDWKVFRAMVPEVRERYLASKNNELKLILTEEGKTPTEQFWNTANRCEEISKILVECLDGHSRSKMDLYMGLMLRHGLLSQDDLTQFSPELRESLRFWTDPR